jgi:hypothetical protein
LALWSLQNRLRCRWLFHPIDRNRRESTVGPIVSPYLTRGFLYFFAAAFGEEELMQMNSTIISVSDEPTLIPRKYFALWRRRVNYLRRSRSVGLRQRKTSNATGGLKSSSQGRKIDPCRSRGSETVWRLKLCRMGLLSGN